MAAPRVPRAQGPEAPLTPLALLATWERPCAAAVLVDGEIVDAVYARLEGRKAITRMLGERDGTATFAPGAPAIMRRIHESTRALVTEAKLVAERVDALRSEAGDLVTSTLLGADAPVSDSLSEIDQHVLSRLRVPRGLRLRPRTRPPVP